MGGNHHSGDGAPVAVSEGKKSIMLILLRIKKCESLAPIAMAEAAGGVCLLSVPFLTSCTCRCRC